MSDICMMRASDRQDSFLTRRRRMVDEQIRGRGVHAPAVLEAMLAVPREQFLPAADRDGAYEDRALPIGRSQTISQPYMVAYMTEQLAVTPTCRVLEIGTGTGYQTAILARLAKSVFSVERIDELRQLAADHLADLNISNVTLVTGDGSVGLPTFAPYDRIIVTAGAPRVPESLVEQLVDGGRLIIPVGGATEQYIVCAVRDGERTIETKMLACRFVKLIGKEGWSGGLFGR